MEQHFLEGSFTMHKPKKAKKPKKPKLAIVVWIDAFDGPTGWVDSTEYKPLPVRPVSVGWVVEDFLKDHITLVGTHLVDRNDLNSIFYSNPSHIPLGMVQSITYIDTPSSIEQLIIKDLNTRGFNAD